MSEKDVINHINYNQTANVISIGTTTGFHTFSMYPLFKYISKREYKGGIRHVELLYNTNIIALVSSSNIDQSENGNRVILWDDSQQKAIGEMSFKVPVISVKIRRDTVIAITLKTIFLYNLKTLELLQKIETIENPLGLCQVSYEWTSHNEYTLVCPGISPHTLRVNKNSSQPILIDAHDNEITSLGLSYDGKLVATASEHGTIIRVFDTNNGQQINEFRRGTSQATIYNICFNSSNSLLACTSNSGTLHIFSLDKTRVNRESYLKMFSLYISYFSSQWSFLQYRISNEYSLAAFCRDDPTIITVISKDGSCKKLKLELESTPTCSILEEFTLI